MSSDDLFASLETAQQCLEERHFSEALALYRATAESSTDRLDSVFALAKFGYAQALIGLHRTDEALEEFRAAFQASIPHLEGGLRLAEMLLSRCEYESARAVYDDILHTAPSIAEAQYGLAVALWNLENAEGARTSLKRSLSLQPTYPAASLMDAMLPMGLPSPSPKRRQPLLCVLLSPYVVDWPAGQIYIVNFARALSKLPRRDRPRIVVFIAIDIWERNSDIRETVSQLQDCETVLGVFDQFHPIVSSSPALDRYRRFARKSQLSDNEWSRWLLTSSDYTFPLLYPSWGIPTFGQPLYWIPDFKHRIMEREFTLLEMYSRDNDMTALCRRDVLVVLMSRTTLREFNEIFANTKCRTHVLRCYPLPSGAPVRARNQYWSLDLPDRFYYVPNQLYPSKDYETLCRAMRILLDDGFDIRVVSTCGSLDADDPYRRQIRRLVGRLGLDSNLIVLDPLPRELQLEVMRNALAILQPSLYEGWGLGIEDARMLGRPIVLSDIPIHREHHGVDAKFFEAGNPSAFAAAIKEINHRVPSATTVVLEKAGNAEVLGLAIGSARTFMQMLHREQGNCTALASS